MSRESMEFDVVIVGAGPAGLSAAIRLAQLAKETDRHCNICVLEKAANVGGHILSGAVLDPKSLEELIPDWRNKNAPVQCKTTEDQFLLLTQSKSYHLPTPPQMDNQGNYIISLGLLCQWLADQAEQLGISVFPGFSATECLFAEDGTVIGVATGDMGLNKDGTQGERFTPGVNLHAKQILLAEGCRGSLTKQIIQRYNLRENPQTYALGIKELWEVPKPQHQEGLVIHSVGWPLDSKTYGGSFLYHWDNSRIEIGFVVGLDYQNPYLDPFLEFQRYKQHPTIRPMLEHGKRIAYGAKSLVEGGLQGLPKLEFPGGLIIGDSAGFLNVPKIKGIHTAMKSGMLAAESVHSKLNLTEHKSFQEKFESSWLHQELHRARNIRPAFQWGLLPGLAYAAIDTYLFRGNAPWTFKHHHDYSTLKPAKQSKKINYPKADNVISFDKLSSVFLANTSHRENQPDHLLLKDPSIAINVNYQSYASPETRYCPANVYEIVELNGNPKLQINAANCVHCKTCDIKDPEQNITWVPPEGGSGPNYNEL